MERGSRVWRMYYGIQVAIWATALGVFLGVRFLVEEAWGLDIARPPSVLLVIAFFLVKHRAENVAKAACRKAGLWQEPPRGSRVDRVLRPVEPSEIPISSPAPLDLGRHSRRSDWIGVCIFVLIGAGSVALTIEGVLERNLEYVATGILSALMFFAIAAAVMSSIHDNEVEVDTQGLHLKARRRVVLWSSIESGKVSRDFAVDGTLHRERLTLRGTRGKLVWNMVTHRLPPQIRVDLFAWVQARTGLREPRLHEEMYAWLESISGTFAHR